MPPRKKTRATPESWAVSEGAKIALIADDPLAMRVLAMWACGQFELSHALDNDTADNIADLLGEDPDDVVRALRRAHATGCLQDRGVSQLADRFLQQAALAAVRGRIK